MKIIKILFLSVIIFSFIDIYSQPYNPYAGIGGMQCQEINNYPTVKNLVTPGGNYKPERTDEGSYPNTSENSAFNILIVFVQFANDNTYSDNPDWPAQDDPTYLNTLLASSRRNDHKSDWWNEYNESTETISDYFMEVSRGKFHVVGNCISIVLPHDSSYYQLSSNKIEQLNSDLYDELVSQVDWDKFDKWKYENGTFAYGNGEDHIIDMIYVVHRIWRDNIFTSGLIGSMAQLFNSKQGQSHSLGNGFLIKAGGGVEGSGITFTTGQGTKIPRAPFSKNNFLTVQAHELGHYLFGGGHQNYGIMMGGWMTGYIATGLDSRLSPWETAFLGYGNPKVIDFSGEEYNVDNHLSDFSSRDGSAELQVIQVPNNINDPNEFFLLAFRSKVSAYDRVMWGDTAKNDCFRNINPEYGKGIYIYHTKLGYTWVENTGYREIDQECADGLFDWEFGGLFYPDWSDNQQLVFFNKTNVSRANDMSYGSLYAVDEKSVLYNYNGDYYNCWGGIGKKHTCVGSGNCNESTNRIYANENDILTSRAWEGDRWDAWNKNYNEIFSPYSCPSTKQWNSSTADIFIWIYAQNQNGVDFKIYKTGYGGYNLSDILEETPPSRPMGLTISWSECSNGVKYPQITWEHNIEPDMSSPLYSPLDYRRYKIFRAYELGNDVPGNFEEIADQYFNANSNPSWIDFNASSECSFGQSEYRYNVRYKVKAVDNYNMSSVYSDFVSTQTLKVRSNNGDNFRVENSDLPKSFYLNQNYPNPFNPVTNIKYDLPKDVFVKIKIYDLLGREIKTLVNEFKQAGSYLVSFNGSEFASGIYFYKIQAGNFIQVKRMMLIK